MWWIRCVRCKKLQHDFVARTFALIEPVQYVLQQVSCSYETISNAPKYYETDRNISFGSNGVDWVRSLRKIPMWFVARTFALIAPIPPVLHRVSCSYETIPNASKHYEMGQNMSLGFYGLDRVWSLPKLPTRLCGTNILINCTILGHFAPCFI